MRWGVLLAVLSAVALIAGPAGATSIQDIINGGGSIQFGDKVFSDFQVTGIDPSAVDVLGGSDGFVFIQFVGDFTDSNDPLTAADDGSTTYSIQYTVTDKGGLIDGIDQSFNLDAGGNGGNVTIGETVWGSSDPYANVLAQSSVSFVFAVTDACDSPDPNANCPPEGAQGDQLIIDPARSVVYVEKNIVALANTGGVVGASIIEQSFHQTAVPEPATLFLLGTGLVGTAFAARRLRRK